MNNGNAAAIAAGPQTSGVGVPSMQPIESLLERLGPRAVFGEPVRSGEATVIPVAEVRTGLGFGGGQGRSAKPAPEQGPSEGGGSGGGAAARVIPRGYIVAVREQVRYEPIPDVTRMALAGMTLVGWIAYLLARALRR